MLRGIMVSEDDNNIDFSMIDHNDIEFLIIRSGYTSYGKNKEKYKDSKFEEYYSKALKENYEVFIYYESCATNIYEAREEANYFLKIIEGKEIIYPLFVFINDDHNTVIYSELSQKELPKKELNNVINEFCKVIRKNGYDIFILSEREWFKNELDILKTDGKCLNVEIDDSKEYKYINITENNEIKDDKIEIVLNKNCLIDKIGNIIETIRKFIKNKINKIFK